MTVNPAAEPDDRDTPPTAPTEPPPTVPPPTEPPPPAPPYGELPEHVRRSRAGFAWTALVIGAVVAILLLVFILQNLNEVRVELLFWHFNLPVGVGALLSAIGGALVMAVVGGLRIWQLRRAAKVLARPPE